MSAVVRRLAHAVYAWLLLSPAWTPAVILYSDSNRNGTPAADSIAYPAWQLQGQFLGNLATPIASSYFITAHHIGGKPTNTFTFQATVYSIDPSFATSGKADIPNSDLTLWKINGTFPTYATLYTASDEINQHLVVIGRGTPRGQTVTVNNNVKGWLWGADDYFQSWGENDVANVPDFGPGLGDMLQFDFNSGNNPNEAALSRGDSGGGVFIQESGVWKLAGINYGVDGYYSKDSSGANPFLAAIYDKTGLYQGDPGTPTQPFISAHGAGASFASRISSRTSAIYSLIPGCSVVQQNYTVTGTANMGNVDVANTTTVGTGTAPAVLTAYHLRTTTLNIANAAQVIISPMATSAGTSKVSTLNIAPTGQFDLADNDLIVQADSLTWQNTLRQITTLVVSGRDTGPTPWHGYGIASNAAANNPMTALAVIVNDHGDRTPIFTTFGGLPVDPNSILVKYTWNGDANLDGIVNADDYFLADSGYVTQKGGWNNGDFNYDGIVNADDYFLIDSAFIGQNATLSGGYRAPVATTPEPALGAILVMAAAGLLLRRRSNAGPYAVARQSRPVVRSVALCPLPLLPEHRAASVMTWPRSSRNTGMT